TFRDAPCFSRIRNAGTMDARNNRATMDQGSLSCYMARREALLLVTLLKVFVKERAIGVPAAIASLTMSVMRANLSRERWVAFFSSAPISVSCGVSSWTWAQSRMASWRLERYGSLSRLAQV